MYKIGSLILHHDRDGKINYGYIYNTRGRINDICWIDGSSSWYSDSEIQELISIKRLEVYQ